MSGLRPRAASALRSRSRSPSESESGRLLLWMKSISCYGDAPAEVPGPSGGKSNFVTLKGPNLRLHHDLQPLAAGEAFGVAAFPRHLERDRLVGPRAGPRVPHARVRHAPVLH